MSCISTFDSGHDNVSGLIASCLERDQCVRWQGIDGCIDRRIRGARPPSPRRQVQSTEYCEWIL